MRDQRSTESGGSRDQTTGGNGRLLACAQVVTLLVLGKIRTTRRATASRRSLLNLLSNDRVGGTETHPLAEEPFNSDVSVRGPFSMLPWLWWL